MTKGQAHSALVHDDETAILSSSSSRKSPSDVRRALWMVPPALIEWLCLVAGLFLVWRYAWLIDDAYVYFRYADNLLYLNFGLVYNRGEFVEGYSSPFWMLLMIATRLTGLNYWWIVRLLGAFAFLCFWYGAVVAHRRLAPRSGPVVNVPLCFMSFTYGPLCYFTSGLESPFVQVAAVVYALGILLPRARWLHVMLSLSPLIRQELALTWLFMLIWIWRRNRRFPFLLLGTGLAFGGGWLLFRVYYYADLFPNTFYLKDTVDVTQGLLYVWDTLEPYGLYLYLAACLVIAAGLVLVSSPRGSSKSQSLDLPPATSARLYMLFLSLLVAAYVVKIGGDPRHYRFLAFSIPLALLATAGLVEQALMGLRWRQAPLIGNAIGLVVAALCLTLYPRQLGHHPLAPGSYYRHVNKIADAHGHRRRTLSPSPWESGDSLEQADQYEQFLGAVPAGDYGMYVAGNWCVTSYNHFDKRVIHSFGLTDAVLARMVMPADRPAHKFGLVPRARELLDVYALNSPPGRGMFRQAVARGNAPSWVVKNIDALEIIERKIFNRHDFLENLGLAFTFPPPIQP